jgi:maleamate amidohydrolase
MDELSTKQLYRRLSFGESVGFGKRPAALVIDFQKGLTLPDMPLYGWHDEQIAQTTRLLDALRQKGYPVVFTVVAYDEAELLNECYPILKKIPSLRSLKAGSILTELDDRLRRRADEFLVVKKSQSAFSGTCLGAILTSVGVDTLLVAGCATSGCVRGSVMDACGLGYRVILVRECIGDFTSEVHDANFFDMGAKNADIVGISDAVKYVSGLPASSGRAEPNAATMRGA